MGVKSSKHSYNVEKVGHGVKARGSLKIKEVDEKQWSDDANDTVIEEIINAAHKVEQPPRLSKEELKKEEELIIAKVKGEVVSSTEDKSPQEEIKVNAVSDVNAITVIKEEINESIPILTVQSIVDAEKECTEQIVEPVSENHISLNDCDRNQIEDFVPSQIEEIGTITCTNYISNAKSEDYEIFEQQTDINNEDISLSATLNNDDKKQNEETYIKKSIDTNESTCLIQPRNNEEAFNTETVKEEVTIFHNESSTNEANDITPKESYLQQIFEIEKIVNGMKAKLLHFSGSADDKEFSILHEELIKHIIKLDDITFDDEEVKSERRRVIRMIQQCVQNLEKKIEESDDGRHFSDSE